MGNTLDDAMTEDEGLVKIDVSENLILESDLDDGWLMLKDKDQNWYEELGAVAFQDYEIDALIEQLAHVRNRIKLRQELQQLPSEGGG